MAKRVLCILTTMLLLFSLILTACSNKEKTAATTLSAEELSENRSLYDGRFSFNYEFTDTKAKSIKSFTDNITEVYISLPAFESKEDIDAEYVSDFFIRFFSGIDPYSFDAIEGDDGRRYAAVTTDRIYSLLFYMLRVDDYKMPAKDENPDFYAEGENAFVLVEETDGSTYHITKEVDDETGCYVIFTKGSKGSDAPEYRIDFAEDEYGCYFRSITV